MFKILDLFAGAGGMSYGFMQTGKFEVAVAVEKDVAAQKTYKKNHPSALIKGDICEIDFEKFVSENGKIDLVIGGPPCQGFSNANRQKNQLISTNNQLVKKYVDAVMKVSPKAFVMENVGMLQSKTHRFFVTNSEKDKICSYGIALTRENLKLGESKVLADFFSATHVSFDLCRSLSIDANEFKILNVLYKNCNNEDRMRSCILRHKSKLTKCLLRQIDLYSENRNDVEGDIWKYLLNVQAYIEDESLNAKLVRDNLTALLDVQKTLLALRELYENDIDFDVIIDKEKISVQVDTYTVEDYLNAALGTEYHLASGILKATDFGVPQNRERYILMGILKKLASKEDIELPKPIKASCKYTVRHAIGDLECVPITTEMDNVCIPKANLPVTMTKYQRYVCDSELIYNHIATATRNVALRRFMALKPGQNFHDLSDELKLETYSNLERTQNTIYKRLDYEKISGTVLNVRKSMWIHPVLDRAVSIREAARLQSFKDSFVFYGTKDSQYQQVGNAVPPLMAQAIAEKVLELLKEKPNVYLTEII